MQVLWFKRDLRLQDHAPLSMAIAEQLPILLIYCFEPSLLAAPQHSTRHWRFVYESLLDMQRQLTLIGVKLHIFHAEVEEVLERLTQVPWNGDSAKPHQTSQIHQLFCHQETGHKLSFDRDKRVKALCERKGITYQEFVQDGVIRGRKHRRGFKEHADAFLAEPLIKVPINKLAKLSIALPPSAHNVLVEQAVPPAITSKDKNFQPGGETAAWRYLHSFTTERAYRYSYQLSSPSKSRQSCSRLSPYLAWGCLSARQVWRWTRIHEKSPRLRGQLESFRERLWWRLHYFQKLEAEWQIEFEPINRALKILDRTTDQEKFAAWAEGRTGRPMVDACMRCLKATGWLNFRMRAMLVTVATFGLWLDWRLVAKHLGRLFL
ncbi:MAG: FAD-binding domain-containing protein, partial [Bacteroidota bacterium]